MCTFLYTAELIEANPMPLIGRTKVAKSLPKSYPAEAITELVDAIDADQGSARRNNWPERDRAIVFTSLLAGLRADELINANIGDIRRTDGGAVLHVRAAKATRTAKYLSAQSFSMFSNIIHRPASLASRSHAGDHQTPTR